MIWNVHTFMNKELQSNITVKALDMFGNCQRPVFTLGVAQQFMKKQSCVNLASIDHISRTKIRKKQTSFLQKFVCFWIPEKDFRFNYWNEKSCFYQKLHYFRGSRFSHCFIQSTAPHCSLPTKDFVLMDILGNYKPCPGVDFTKSKDWSWVTHPNLGLAALFLHLLGLVPSHYSLWNRP